MPPHDYLAFLHSLGWLAALAFAALLPSLPGRGGRAAAGLIAFCAVRLLMAALALGASSPGASWTTFTAIVGGMAWWEFARREWNTHSRHRIQAAWHLVALECLALTAATSTGAGDAPVAAWQWPIELGFAALPALLGGTALLLLWRHLEPALRFAAAALALHAVLEAFPSLALASALTPWIAAGGFARSVLGVRATRSRAALACLGGLLLVALAGPAAVALRVAQVAERADEEVATRAHPAATALQGAFAARLARENVPGSITLRELDARARALRAADPLLQSVQFEQVRGGEMHRIDLADGAVDRRTETRAATAEETAWALRGRAFVGWPDASAPAGLVTARVPVRVGRFETAPGWLVLRYPAEFWDVQRAHARRSGIAFVGLLAGFCAMGFVLAARQAIENAHRVELERARSADKAKTEFLAFLSHEMRTPLQTILGRTELLRAAPDAGEAARRHTAAIENQALLLLRLVSDLLDLGTLEAGKFQLRPHPFSLPQALAAVEDTLRAPAHAKGIALAFRFAPGTPDALVGDEARLRQVLGNILGNAVKYTRAGRVDLAVECERGEANVAALTFRVTDTGPGLPPEKIPQLFTLFTRLDSGETFTREGTGVGLALVRRLCELMGGSVTAANRPEGGAEFTVRLVFPLAPAPAQETPAGALAAPRRRVLIAEDNAAVREFLAEAIEALGHEVETAVDGPGAIAAANGGGYDVVLLDVNLPGRDGISLARELSARTPRPRLIGCSAEAFAATRAAAREAGMDAFLEKPISVAMLAEALAQPVPNARGASVFERLRTPELAARARELLAAEWPAKHAAATAALRAADFAAVGALAHNLLSSAQLAADPALLAVCQQLSAAAQANDSRAGASLLSQIDARIRPAPAQPLGSRK